MVAHGFADVAAVREGDRLVVAFGNARYRDDRRAVREAAELLLPLLAQHEELVLVPTIRAVPLAAVRFPASAPALPAVSLDLSDLPPLTSLSRAGSSFGRVDVVLHPWFEAVFGDYDNPVASRTGIAPEVRVAIRRGLGLSVQALVAIQDDVPTGETRVRPALVTLNQLVRLPGNLFVSATAGTFTPDRYGADLEARIFSADGRLSAGTQLGLTGATWYSRDGWVRTPMDERTALVDVAWRVAPYDLLLNVAGGAFLEDASGVRVDMVRRFGEVEIGGFLVETPKGANGGIVLRIPLLPAVHPKPRPLRIRAADRFLWQYWYTGRVPGGRPYRTGPTLLDRDRHSGMYDKHRTGFRYSSEHY